MDPVVAKIHINVKALMELDKFYDACAMAGVNYAVLQRDEYVELTLSQAQTLGIIPYAKRWGW